MVRDESGYYEAFYSVLDERNDIHFRRYPSDDGLLAAVDDHWPIRRLKWFSKGFYSVSQRRHDIVITDLRMGVEPSYVFRFKVAEAANPHPKPVVVARIANSWEDGLLLRIWDRIWNEKVKLGPVASRQ